MCACAVRPIKQSSSLFLHKTRAHVELPAGFFSEYHAELKCFLCGFSDCRTRAEWRMRLMVFCFMSLAPVLTWRGGIFSIWLPRQQRSLTLKSLGGTSTQQDTMFTIGIVIHPRKHSMVLNTNVVSSLGLHLNRVFCQRSAHLFKWGLHVKWLVY